MTKSVLAKLIRDQVAQSTVETLTRKTDEWTEKMVESALSDPKFKAEIDQLLHAAFKLALQGLSEEYAMSSMLNGESK